MTLAEFTWAVFAYCTVTGASVTSWIRTRTVNGAVEGVPHSAHLVGLGADVVYDVRPLEAERREWASRLGLLVLMGDDHDHLQPLGWRAG